MRELEQASQLLSSGQASKALALLNRLADPECAHYQVFLYRGIAHMQQHHLPNAVADFTRALELNPGSAAAYANRGSALDQLQQTALANQDHNMALKLEPRRCQHYYNRGLAYANLGDLPRLQP